MPRVDLEALVCGGGGGDARVACETQIAAAAPHVREDPDLPPESILVRIGSGGIDWADVGAAVYERDDSTKGSTNPKAQAQQRHANPNPKPRTDSQRFSSGLQAKPHIIGLPAKIRDHSGYLGRSGRRPANAPIFPNKPPGSGGVGRKSRVPDEEPGSPKVSCIGKVLPERERDRCRGRCLRLPKEEEEKKGEGAEAAGCWASVTSVLCCGGERRTGENTKPGGAPERAAGERRIAVEPEMEPPGLGAMRRFTSGRRPESWGVDVDVDVDKEMETDKGRVARPRALDRDAPAWGPRMSVGSLEGAWRQREMGEADGSASV